MDLYGTMVPTNLKYTLPIGKVKIQKQYFSGWNAKISRVLKPTTRAPPSPRVTQVYFGFDKCPKLMDGRVQFAEWKQA